MMLNHSDARNARNKTTLSLSLAILIIIMDMSGLAGLASEDTLSEEQKSMETISSNGVWSSYENTNLLNQIQKRIK